MRAPSRLIVDLWPWPLFLATILSACHESHKTSAGPSDSASAEPGALTPELAKQVLAKVGDR